MKGGESRLDPEPSGFVRARKCGSRACLAVSSAMRALAEKGGPS